MNEVKTTFRRMVFYYFLMAINIIPNASIIPDSFPTRNVSFIYLLTLCVCLVLYYSHRVLKAGGLSVMMKALSWMSLLLILLRGIKYSALAEVGILARHTWYFYYVPMLLLPLLMFYISLLVSPKEKLKIRKGWFLPIIITVIFIIAVLTNDLHQQVFRFQPNFSDWDNTYSHGWLFYAVTLWQYALYFAAVGILVFKCRISSSKKNAWIITIPFAIGLLMNVLLLTERMPMLNGSHIIEFPEALIFTVAIVLECCIQLGLIPTNTDYGKLFQKFSVSAQITDKEGKPVYSSSTAIPLTKEQFSVKSGSRIGEHTVLHKMEIPGGFGFWQDDLTELDRLNEELAQAKEELSQEAELIRLRNELKEKQTKTEQRTLVYDTIAKRTQKQSQLISELAKIAYASNDAEIKDMCRRKITFLGAYIKRYANLMLMSQESGVVEAGELALSVSEVLRYLNYCGVPCEFVENAQCVVNADAVLAVFEAFEIMIETNFSNLKGAFVNLSEQQEAVVFKLTLENPAETLPHEVIEQLLLVDIKAEEMQEDNVAYISFTLPKGGEAR